MIFARRLDAPGLAMRRRPQSVGRHPAIAVQTCRSVPPGPTTTPYNKLCSPRLASCVRLDNTSPYWPSIRLFSEDSTAT
jgi:hypothetical protein